MEKKINYENLRYYAYSNDQIVKGEIKGIVIEKNCFVLETKRKLETQGWSAVKRRLQEANPMYFEKISKLGINFSTTVCD